MKRSTFISRKEALFSVKTQKEELVRIGDDCMEAERLHDAVAFYRRAAHEEGLEAIRNIAVEQGDAFLFQSAAGDADDDDLIEQWKTLAKNAEAQGRRLDAKKAFTRCDDQVGVKRVQSAIDALKNRQDPIDPSEEDGDSKTGP